MEMNFNQWKHAIYLFGMRELRSTSFPFCTNYYFMLSCRISRNIGENIFRSYTGTTSENTEFHVLAQLYVPHYDMEIWRHLPYISRAWRNIVMSCYVEGVRHGEKRKGTVLDFDKASPRNG